MSDHPVCLNCGHPMTEIKCKARCLHCGYFEDCSDLMARFVMRAQDKIAATPSSPAANTHDLA